MDRIYLARYTVATYYDFRVDTLETRLKELQAQREKTIQKLKDATKYDSTMELLEKYGGGSKPNKSPEKSITSAADPKAKFGGAAAAPKRTNQPPPPTANINRVTSSGVSIIRNTETSTPSAQIAVSEEFAPNAFGDPASTQLTIPNPVQRTSSLQISGESHWYDRILDLLLGEDEKDPKNRIVLMCQKCRLINGQAPPGVKSLEEIGIWKCMSCGASNGKLDEGVEILDVVLKAQETVQAGSNIPSPRVNSDRTSSSSSSSSSQ
ncbi:hypothetical protein Cpir12675_005978 [Ceratocystis pirilliformis]|uniref:Endoplasmic reticulum junction formation protein lunapark n=1 Tax=Ceratocystis pirilliformis TaxID=259994 RepID=A0ABR3YNG1_9PEZI